MLIKIKKNKKNKAVRCDNCKIDFHRTSYSLYLKNKKHLKIIQQNEVFIFRRNPIKRIEKKNIKLSTTNVERPYYFTDEILKIADDINIDNDLDKNANSILTITSNFNKTGIDTICINKMMIEMANIYA